MDAAAPGRAWTTAVPRGTMPPTDSDVPGPMKLFEAPFVTTADLIRDLRLLGVREGRNVMVHSSLKSFVRVAGGGK